MKKIKRCASAIEGMGMYLIGIVLAILTIITLLYVGGDLVSRLYNFFDNFFKSFFQKFL